MPRRRRIYQNGITMHIVQRANNRHRCFFRDNDYALFLQWLETYAHDFHCDVHAFVLMTNHIHLLLTPRSSGDISGLMKRLDQRYAQYINRTYARTGALWDGRYFSCLVQSEEYVLRCQRYIELNPVRAGIVARILRSESNRHWGAGLPAGLQEDPSGLPRNGLMEHSLWGTSKLMENRSASWERSSAGCYASPSSVRSSKWPTFGTRQLPLDVVLWPIWGLAST